jgi:Zn-finger nucleic acid-binding protein
MEVVRVEGVELDRCPFCGGVWFDRDELEAVTRHPLEVEPLAGHTTRRCAYCRISLTTALVQAVPIEVCTACRGAYLDDGELVELAKREISWRRSAAPAEDADRAEFICRGCGERLDVRDGYATSGGLACGRCLAPLEAAAPSPNLMVNRDPEPATIDVLDLVVDFFMRR